VGTKTFAFQMGLVKRPRRVSHRCYWCHSAIGARPPAQPVLVLTGTLTPTTLGLLAPYKQAPAWPCFPQPDGSAQVKPESRQFAAGAEIQLVVADVSHFEP